MDLYEILILIILTAFYIRGFHAATRADKLLSFIGFDPDKYAARISKLEDECGEALEKVEQATDEEINRMELFFNFQESTENLRRQVYEFRKDEYDKKISKAAQPDWFFINPWSECEICMSSIWGAVIFGLYTTGILQSQIAVQFILFVFITAGAVKTFSQLNTTKNEEQEAYNNNDNYPHYLIDHWLLEEE